MLWNKIKGVQKGKKRSRIAFKDKVIPGWKSKGETEHQGWKHSESNPAFGSTFYMYFEIFNG